MSAKPTPPAEAGSPKKPNSNAGSPEAPIPTKNGSPRGILFNRLLMPIWLLARMTGGYRLVFRRNPMVIYISGTPKAFA